MEACATQSSDDAVLWNVQEEHLSEAGFLLSQWRLAFEDPSCTLQSLADGVERRFLAHIDGLVLGGKIVAQELLLRVLADADEVDPALLTSACYALLLGGRAERVTDVLWNGRAEASRAAESALGLAPVPGFEIWLLRAWDTPMRDEHRASLLRLAAQHALGLPNLLHALQSDNLELVNAAAQAAAFATPGTHLRAIEALLFHTEPAVRSHALRSALVHGSQRALWCAAEWTRSSAGPDPVAMLALALFGAKEQQELLNAQLQRETHRDAALCALGFSGQTALVPMLLALMRPEQASSAKLAGEAFSTLTGLEIDSAAYSLPEAPERDSLPPLADDDLDADLVPTPADALPRPNAQALASWWQQRGARAAPRVLAGESWSLQTAIRFLTRAPLRRRHAVALWLTVATGRKARVDTRAFTDRQRAQLAACAALAPHGASSG